jgi:hypothetical protein
MDAVMMLTVVPLERRTAEPPRPRNSTAAVSVQTAGGNNENKGRITSNPADTTPPTLPSMERGILFWIWVCVIYIAAKTNRMY